MTLIWQKFRVEVGCLVRLPQSNERSVSRTHSRRRHPRWRDQIKHVEPLIIPTGKDLGDLDQTVADDLVRQTINRAIRHLSAGRRVGVDAAEVSWLGKWLFNRVFWARSQNRKDAPR